MTTVAEKPELAEENNQPKANPPRKKRFGVAKKTGKGSRRPYAVLRASWTDEGPIFVEEAKELIGWTEEPADEDWGNEFDLKDVFNKKVRLTKNPSNRPLKIAIAKRYSSEFLRAVWQLNLETIVFGKSGDVRDGQHRIVGFILAEQERSLNTKDWGTEPLKMEVLLGFNVPDDPATADSYDKGQNRSLDDVIYRHETFGKRISDKDQRKISKTLAVALRLVWLRSGGQVVSNAPHFPHSEALEFYESHKGILSSVKKIIRLDAGEEGNERLISSLVSLGYAAGLHYLMSRVDKDKANSFWESFASGENLKKDHPIHSCRSYLTRSRADSGKQRDAVVGAIVKAWLAYYDNKKISTKEVAVKRTKRDGKFVLAEVPRIGHLDTAKEPKTKLSTRQRVILSVLNKKPDEITYQQLSEETGLSKGILGREIYSEKNPRCLDTLGLVKVAQYEPEEDEKVAPYYVRITASGKKQI